MGIELSKTFLLFQYIYNFQACLYSVRASKFCLMSNFSFTILQFPGTLLYNKNKNIYKNKNIFPPTSDSTQKLFDSLYSTHTTLGLQLHC